MNTPDLSNYTILVAEDDTNSFKYIQSALKKTNVKVLHANNGKEAVESASDGTIPIHLIVMDAMMPGMSGFEATIEIKKIQPDIPIIMLTAFANQESIRQAIASGCNDYLSKPISSDVLMTVIKKWLIKK